MQMPPQWCSARLLVAGDVMLDRYWFGDVSRISPEAPVPVVRVRRQEERPGGAANVARNAAALGAAVDLVAVVGEDEPGRSLARMLREEGVQAELTADAGVATTVKLRVIGRQQQLLRIDFEDPPGAAALAAKRASFEARLQPGRLVILSDYGKGGLAEVSAMIAAARARDCRVLVDPKGEDYAIYRGATVLTPNLSEFRQVVGSWTGEAQLREKAQRLRRDLGLEALLVTRSEEGMTLFREAGELHVPTLAREVYDVSGAGDTVIGTLGVALAAGLDWPQAVHLANRAAGIVVGKLGTAVASREELFG